MPNLNLKTTCKEHELIKAYLEENASENLALKINAGAIVEQDGKQLINKKTLEEFMSFAGKEAQKLAEKGANSACVSSDVVFGWAVHFFEEDSIIGTLYNPDGSKYVKPKPQHSKTTTTKHTPPAQPKPKHEQASFFDLSTFGNKEDKDEKVEEPEETDEDVNEEDDEKTIEETASKEEPTQQKPKGNFVYTTYQEIKDCYVTSVVAMRLGDFYEIFGQDAVDIAKELELTLTGRDFGLEHRIPMVGFPSHCADNYFNKIAEKHSVIAIDTNGTITKTIEQKESTKKINFNEDDVKKEYNKSCAFPEDDLKKEAELMKAFDQDSLLKLLDLFEENVAIG